MYICLHRATAGGGLPLAQFLDIAVAGGFVGADVTLDHALTSTPDALAELYSVRKLKLGGWGIPYDWRGDESRAEDGLKKLAAHAKVAAALKCDHCGTHISSSSNLPFMENWKFHLDRLSPPAKVLADAGLRLALEFLGPYHIRKGRPHEFIFTPGQMLELADAIGPNVCLLVDSYHVFCSMTPFSELRKLPAARIGWVHLNDAPDRPVLEQQDGHRLIPGEGIIGVGEFMKAISEAGYAGPASVEIFNRDLRALPPLEAAKKAGEGTRKALAEYFKA